MFLLLFRYAPIIPMILVNGAEGIGTAWATKIPNYNPRDIVDNLRRLINDEELHPMVNKISVLVVDLIFLKQFQVINVVLFVDAVV